MSDVLSPEQRSKNMSAIKCRNTKPELLIRKKLHARGYRYRKNYILLPGKPDLALKKYNAVIFVHGCFWHMHDCHLFKIPKTKRKWWLDKLGGNKLRDQQQINSILSLKWRVLIIWECSVKGKTKIDTDRLVDQISNWLHSNESFKEIRGEE